MGQSDYKPDHRPARQGYQEAPGDTAEAGEQRQYGGGDVTQPECDQSADWIIDLGPEDGAAGGQIVAEGRPEQVVKVAASHTGRFLASALMPTIPRNGR